MEHFLLHPDFYVLSKYVTLEKSPEEMSIIFKGGYDITIEPYKNYEGKWRFDHEHIQRLEKEFREIAEEYNLGTHYNNIMVLTLLKINEIDAIYNHNYDTLIYRQRAKELAQLILTVRNTNEKRVHSLVIKTLTGSAKLSDRKLILWVASLVNQSIQDGTIPQGVLGLQDMRMQTDEQLLTTANQVMSKASIKRPLADFLFNLYPYLMGETNINANQNTLISDAMANFYFEVLELFEFINRDDIQSEPKDYIGALLRNRINKLNS